MNSLTEDCQRLARVLADRSRRHELHVFSDTVTINGAHFDRDRFYTIIRRAASLAAHAREFEDEETPALAAAIKPKKRLDPAPLITFRAGPNRRAGFIDLADVRMIEFRADRADRAFVSYQTANGAERGIDMGIDEMFRVAQGLEGTIENTPVILALSKRQEFGTKRIFINAAHVVQAYASFGDVIISWIDNTSEAVMYVSDEKANDQQADTVVELIHRKRLALRAAQPGT